MRNGYQLRQRGVGQADQAFSEVSVDQRPPVDELHRSLVERLRPVWHGAGL